MIHINSRTGHEMLTQEEFNKHHPALAAALNAPRPYQAQGEELKRIRKAADMTLREMARAIGAGLGGLSAMETGRVEPTQTVKDHYTTIQKLTEQAKCGHAAPDGTRCGSCADLAQSEEPQDDGTEDPQCDGCMGECSICSYRHEPGSRYQQRMED